MNYWLVKQEPETYSFDDLVAEERTAWTGVRNFQARNNLRAMCTGDAVLFYHSKSEKAVVGIGEISKEALADPTDETDKWIAVEIKAVAKLAKAVTLDQIKAVENLQNIALVKQSRLSVIPLTKEEFETILELADR